MIGWIMFIVYIEIYGIGVMLYARSRGMKNSAWCLVPFVAFFVMDKLTGGFKVATIQVNKWGGLVIKLTIVALIAYLYAQWGIHALTERNVGPLVQIMCIPIAVSVIVFYMTMIQATREILFLTRQSFRFDWLLCMTLIAIPVIMAVLSRPKFAGIEQIDKT